MPEPTLYLSKSIDSIAKYKYLASSALLGIKTTDVPTTEYLPSAY